MECNALAVELCSRLVQRMDLVKACSITVWTVLNQYQRGLTDDVFNQKIETS